MDVNLCLVAIIEKDTNSDVIVSWSYPILEAGTDKILIAKSCLQEDNVSTSFLFSKYKENWIYIYTFVGSNFAFLPKVTAYSIVLMAKVFNPERYGKLSELLAKRYLSTGQPPKVLEAYLGAYTKDEFNFGTEGKYSATDFDDRKSLVKCSMKNLFSTFGMESVLIFNAVVLKKRIIIYSSRMDNLLETVRCLPIFAWHRKNWAILRPFVTPTDIELEEMASAGVYVAGFTDRVIESREDLYDLFIDVDDRSITIATHAKENFLLGKPHKELAALMVQLSEEPSSTEQQIIKEIATRTKQFLDTLDSIIPQGQTELTIDVIQQQQLSPAMARFLWNLAIAEGKAQM